MTTPYKDDSIAAPALREVAQRIHELEAELLKARAERERLVVLASDMGATRKAVGEMAGLTPARVQQILERARARAQSA